MYFRLIMQYRSHGLEHDARRLEDVMDRGLQFTADVLDGDGNVKGTETFTESRKHSLAPSDASVEAKRKPQKPAPATAPVVLEFDIK
jgi:hypothetical protein